MSRVSIIINNYNYERFLRDAIDSALAQDYGDCEVIVVDDGSSDASPEVIHAYGERIIPIFQPNGGQGAAMNAGFAASSGEWVLFLDADDFLKSSAVSQLLEDVKKGVSKIQFRLICVDASSDPTGKYNPPERLSMPSGDLTERMLREGSYLGSPTSGNLFSRRYLNAIMPMEVSEYRICADRYLNTLAPFRGQILSHASSLGYYRLHGGNNFMNQCYSEDQIITQIQRLQKKRKLIIEEVRRLGLDETNVYAITDKYHALRLAGLRLSPQSYPVENDTKMKILAGAVKASLSQIINRPFWAVSRSFMYALQSFLPSRLVRKSLLRSATPNRGLV
mgnify:CR=1 FL=1